MSLRIGVDTGGTFTDLCAFDESTGQVHVRKVSSTPDDPGRAIIQGVHELLDQIGGRTIDEISYFAHGTTVGTNALLTGRGSERALSLPRASGICWNWDVDGARTCMTFRRISPNLSSPAI